MRAEHLILHLLASWLAPVRVLAALSGRSPPLLPSKDPWYTAPDEFESTSPGTIFRIRSAPGNLSSIYANSSNTYNVLYRTTNSHYEPSWAVTTLFVPKDIGKAKPGNHTSKLLSYQIPYNTPDIDFSPSAILYDLTTDPSSIIVYNDINDSLGRGWYVSVPDHEGPLASFGLGVTEGHAVIDSIRAVKYAPVGPGPRSRCALWGFSGGSIASEWAGELAVQYAPGLRIDGIALGGVAPNLTAILETANQGGAWWSGLVSILMLGVTKQDPDARSYLVSQLKEMGAYNRTNFLKGDNMSPAEAFSYFSGQPMMEYFAHGFQSLEAPIISKLINRDGIQGYHGVPQMPLFIYKAMKDEIAPVLGADEQVERYCEVGANILYERNSIGGHLAEMTNGNPRAVSFLESVLDGRYIHNGCTIRDVAVNITDSEM